MIELICSYYFGPRIEFAQKLPVYININGRVGLFRLLLSKSFRDGINAPVFSNPLAAMAAMNPETSASTVAANKLSKVGGIEKQLPVITRPEQKLCLICNDISYGNCYGVQACPACGIFFKVNIYIQWRQVNRYIRQVA